MLYRAGAFCRTLEVLPFWHAAMRRTEAKASGRLAFYCYCLTAV
jgi:hypothetical protein